MTLRSKLLLLQRDHTERLERELRDGLVRDRPAVKRYLERYRRDLEGPFTTTTRDQLVRAAASAEIVYVGDYHTLEAAQRAFLWLCERVHEETGPLALGLEMLEPRDQPHLERYLARKIEEAAFLEAIRYESRWGFAWPHYEPILAFAKRTGSHVFGFDRRPSGRRATLALRDRFAASVIARKARELPGIPLLVLVGDLHLARGHLPGLVEGRLGPRGTRERRRVIVFQNAEALYWKLAEKGLEQTTEVVRLDRERFCLMGATPLAKVRSFLDWARREGGSGDEDERMEDEHEERTQEVLGLVADFFGVDAPDDLPELEPARTSARVLDAIAPAGAPIVRTPLDRSAEDATRRLRSALVARVTLREPGRARADAFYALAIEEALGFLGSLVANHARATRSERDFEAFLARSRGRHLERSRADARRAARSFLEHVRAEDRWLSGERKRAPFPRGLHRAAAPVREGAARALGERLGMRLYRALIAGSIGRARLHRLLVSPLAGQGEARAVYLELVRDTGGRDLARVARPRALPVSRRAKTA